MSSDDRMRALLDDAVSDVEPREGLSAIRARTSPRSRRSWLVTGGAVLATAAVVTAIAVLPGVWRGPGDDEAAPAADGERLDRTLEARVPVPFVTRTGAGPRLVNDRLVVDDADPDAVMSAAVSGEPTDPDYVTLWPEGTSVSRVEAGEAAVEVDLANDTVDLARRPSGMTSEQATISLQQLVYADDAEPGPALTFTINGSPTDMLLGVDVSQPLAPRPADEVFAPVSIDSPSDGEAVPTPFTVTGEAATFEANVQWELTDGDEVVRSGFATAAECCTLSPYSFEVEAPPGEYTLRVFEEDVSDGEGNPPGEDTKQVTVE